MAELYPRIFRRAKELESETAAFLMDMVRVPSFSGTEKEVIQVIKAEMEKAGFDEVRIDGLGNVIGRIGNGPRVIAFDARRAPGYAPYDELEFQVPGLDAGDVDARVWIRIHEVEQSLALIEQLLARLPAGTLREDVAAAHSVHEGIALVEGFRGDVLVWLRLGAHGRIERCHLRDPSWFQWPLLEVAIEGNIVADFPLCNKSFNCSYSGHDL